MILIWNTKTPVTLVASAVWNLSEYTEIPLGYAAPYVFKLMMGKRKIKKRS